MLDVRREVRDFIVKTFAEAMGVPAPADHESLLLSGVIDSFNVFEIIAFLEEQYGLSIAPEEITPENLDGISRITDFVTGKLSSDHPLRP